MRAGDKSSDLTGSKWVTRDHPRAELPARGKSANSRRHPKDARRRSQGPEASIRGPSDKEIGSPPAEAGEGRRSVDTSQGIHQSEILARAVTLYTVADNGMSRILALKNNVEVTASSNVTSNQLVVEVLERQILCTQLFIAHAHERSLSHFIEVPEIE
jgi:hypothetical protein